MGPTGAIREGCPGHRQRALWRQPCEHHSMCFDRHAHESRFHAPVSRSVARGRRAGKSTSCNRLHPHTRRSSIEVRLWCARFGLGDGEGDLKLAWSHVPRCHTSYREIVVLRMCVLRMCCRVTTLPTPSRTHSDTQAPRQGALLQIFSFSDMSCLVSLSVRVRFV